jgi:type I restriction enzyme S subunit
VNFVPMRAVEPEGGGLLKPEICPYGEVKKGYTAFQSGDVIMAKITPCMENGKTTVVPDLPGTICFGSTEFHVLRAESGIEPKWLANFLLQHEVRRAAQRKMTGGVGQMRVPASFLKHASIPVAPSAEQQRITDTVEELLSDLDAGVTALDRVQKKLAQYRAAVLKAAVEGNLTEEWRAQHPVCETGSDFLTRILAERRKRWEEDQLLRFDDAGKEAPRNWRTKYREPASPETARLPALPEGWCWATCDQLAWTAGYGTSEKCRESNSGLAVLRIPNIIAGNLDLTDLKHAPPEYSEREEELVRVGDLMIVRTNGSRDLIGRGAVVQDPPALRLSFASYLIRLRLVPLSPLLRWVALTWGSAHARQWIESRAATSAGQFNINLGVLSSLPLPVPPVAEQEAIAEIVEDQLSVVDHLETDLESRLGIAAALRQVILRYAFSGRLVPQCPDDEPASNLLQRIAAERIERTRQVLATKATPKNGIPSGRRAKARN